MRNEVPSADQVVTKNGFTVVVFNLGPNACRVIAAIHYDREPLVVFIRAILTHEEYERNRWRDLN